MRPRLRSALCLVGVLVALVLGAAPAHAERDAALQSFNEHISGYDVDITIEDDGTLLIHETIDYDFGVVPKHGIRRFIPDRFDYPKKEDTDRVYPIDDISVRGSEGTPDQYEVEGFTENGIGYTVLKIGDPDRTIDGEHTYDITYRMHRVLNAFNEHDELVFNAIGVQWPVSIDQSTVTVSSPAPIRDVLCSRGVFGSVQPCDNESVEGSTATFRQGQLFPFEGMTVTLALPKGAVKPAPKPELEERWTFGRAFAVNSTTGPLFGLLLLVVVGGFLARWYFVARDRRYKGSAVDQAFGTGQAEEVTPLFEHTETPVEFVPPDDLRPGQVGTLADFTAHPLDVSATIVDLAVRKYLVIEEIDTESKWPRTDWKLTKLEEPGDELKKYEQELMKGLFRDEETVELSDLRQHFAKRMAKVQKELMDDAMEQGWFTKRPVGMRATAGCLGFLVLAFGITATVLLAVFTHAALLGAPFAILGVVMMVAAYWAPSRTAKGSGVLRRVNGFRRFIEESEKDRAQFAEKANLFSEYLPYAIVFGAVDKWARAFAGLAAAPPDTSSWYRSTTPFEYIAFSSAIDGFSVTTSGTLTSTPPSTSGSSGFSSGGSGFSGGGAGGGGGGSW
ncbi:MAG: DUF2207 domain-containing protein [Acidimicrobiia bacterium]